MVNNKIRGTFPFYSFDSNYDKRTLYGSFRFVSLTVYIIGTLYLSLNNSYECNTSEIILFDNVISRKLAEVCTQNYSGLGNENIKNSYEENTEITKSCCKNDIKTCNEESEHNESQTSQDDVDITKQLTREQLHDIVNSLGEIPSREFLLNLWKQTLEVSKDGLEPRRAELGEYKEKYGEGYEYNTRNKKKRKKTNYHKEFDQRLSIHENDYTNKFKTLIEGSLTVNELRSFIFLFIAFFHNLIDYLFHRYKIKYIQEGTAIPTKGTIDETLKEKQEREEEEGFEENLHEDLGENIEENQE
ncbi:Plasmodium exported protein, unknown function [Plasmodium reichenowi]|uniref:Plasmodium RESA N-terminal domain-containing protein n=1 Tax=Plasmodium reichenowi TaxID=5854 RepID=A0A060RWP8_PLARE|nr:Plasmodium exported protein, unknown function [Plasmodium reichenowi]